MTSDAGNWQLAQPLSGLPTARDISTRLDSSPVAHRAVIITDRDGHVTYANDGAASLYGPVELGAHIEAAASTDDPRLAGARREITAQSSWSGEVRRRHSDGSLFLAAVTVSAITDSLGNVVGTVDVSSDATLQAVAFRFLREMATAIDTMNDAVVITDPEGRITGWNRRAEALYGYTTDEIVGRGIQEIVPDRAPSPERLDILRAGGRIDPYVTERRRKDGSARTVSVSLSGVVAEGELLALVDMSRDVTAEQDAKRALEASERLHRSLVARSADAAVIIDEHGTLTYVSDAVKVLSGRRSEDMIGTPAFDYVHPDDVDMIRRGFAHSLAAGDGFISEQTTTFRFRCADDTYKWAELVVTNLTGDSVVGGLVCNIRDVTDGYERDRALAASEARYRSLARNASDTAVIIDDLGRFTWVSPSTTRLLGYEVADLIGRSSKDILVDPASGDQHMRVVLDGRASNYRFETELRHADGTHTWFETVASNLLHDPDVRGIVVNMRDVTERRQADAELRRRALHDSLTGLPNRVQILERIDAQLRADDQVARGLAVLLCDLDDFKLVNDTLGHLFGDQLLQVIANRLVGAVRNNDMVARLGGDEFVILCERIDQAGAVEVARRVLAAISEPLSLGDAELTLTGSVGIAFGPTSDGPTLLSNADAAMYEAKGSGKGRVGVYDAKLRDAIAEKLSLTNDLRRAVRNEELELHYQPIVDLVSGEPVGAEALLRWTHPVRGPIGPAVFVPIAEDSGLIETIGRWLLRQACHDFGPDGVLGDSGLRVSVNVSARQVDTMRFLPTLDEAMQYGRIAPSCLRLEVTESAIMSDPDLALRILTEVRRRGVGLAIDDFGTGYSSLAYLKRFPFETVKVDRSFVAGVGDSVDDTVIIEAIVKVANTLHMDVTAEGIETADMVPRLRALGCRTGQGWLWAPAMSAEHLRSWLSDQS